MSHLVGNIWATIVSFDACVHLQKIEFTSSFFFWIGVAFLVLNLIRIKHLYEYCMTTPRKMRLGIYLEALPLCRALVFDTDAQDEGRRGSH